MKQNNTFKNFALFSKDHNVGTTTLLDYQRRFNNFITPFIPEERQLNVTMMDIFSRLMMDRIIFITEISSETCNIINSQLMFLASVDGKTPIKLHINSPGGEVISGLAVYDIMNWVPCDVETYGMGLCASMGAILISSGTKGKRYALPNSSIMIHQPLGGTYGQATDILINAREIEKWRKRLYDILVDNTGKPFEAIEKDCERDFWMTSKEAQEYGLIDHVIETKKS